MGILYLDSNGAATNSGTSDNNSPDLSGAANATIVANATFVDANVTVATDIVNVAAHGYPSGTGVELTTSGTLPAGLTLTTLYYLFAVDANNITFHTNLADALAGTNPVNITAAAGGGTHTINNYTVRLGGSPDLSAVVGSHCYVSTTGTSHVFSMGGGIHGLNTGDLIWLELTASGTMPTNTVEAVNYFVNALSTTTFRIYTTAALALAGGASDINVSTVAVRTLTVRGVYLVHPQSAINLPSATNANRRTFWVRAVDNTNKQLILQTTATGLGAGSNWAIGGRVPASGIIDFSNAIRSGDTVIQNTDITLTSVGTGLAPRNEGAENFGVTRWYGLAGARRLLAVNAGNQPLFNTPSLVRLHQKNLEIQNIGASTAAICSNGAVAFLWEDVRVTDGINIHSTNGSSHIYLECEITGINQYGSATNTNHFAYRSYFHDFALAASGTIQLTFGQNFFLFDCIIERGAGDAVLFSGGTTVLMMLGCTVYRHSTNGVRITGSSTGQTSLGVALLFDNIFKDNGNAATEANINVADRTLSLLIERRNLVSIDGALGGVNVLGFTLDAGDIEADPLFIDPDNGTPADRDFGLQTGSPAFVEYTYVGSNIEHTYVLGAVSEIEAGTVDANITHVNGIEVGGTGALGDEWGPVGASAPPTDVNVVSVNGVLVTGTGAPGDEWGPA